MRIKRMFRQTVTAVSFIIKKALISLLIAYRYFLSPWLGNRCRFYPSCSSYSLQALEEYGVIKGIYVTGRRLLRCHPWNPGGYDPVISQNERIK